MSDIIYFKDRSIGKRNKYVFCAIVDENNMMMVDKTPNIQEYFDHICDISIYVSDFIIDTEMYRAGYSHKMPKTFFKAVDPKLLHKTYKNTNRISGKYPRRGEKTYLYQNMYHALFNSEDFHSGLVWMFGHPETFNDFKKFFNRLFICKVNHSFAEIYPDAKLWYFEPYGEIKSEFTPNSVTKAKSSIKLLSSKVEENIEILSPHIKMIHSKKDIKKKLKDQLNIELYDYQFLTYEL